MAVEPDLPGSRTLEPADERTTDTLTSLPEPTQVQRIVTRRFLLGGSGSLNGPRPEPGLNSSLFNRHVTREAIIGGLVAGVAATIAPGFIRTLSGLLLPKSAEAVETVSKYIPCEPYPIKNGSVAISSEPLTPLSVEALMAPSITPDGAPTWRNACNIIHMFNDPSKDITNLGVNIDLIRAGFTNRQREIKNVQNDTNLAVKTEALFKSASREADRWMGIPLVTLTQLPIRNGLITLGESTQYQTSIDLKTDVLRELAAEGYEVELYTKGKTPKLLFIFVETEDPADLKRLKPIGGSQKAVVPGYICRYLYNGKIDPNAVILILHEGWGHGLLGRVHYDEINLNGTEPSYMLSGDKGYGQKVYATKTDITGNCEGRLEPDPIINPNVKPSAFVPVTLLQ